VPPPAAPPPPPGATPPPAEPAAPPVVLPDAGPGLRVAFRVVEPGAAGGRWVAPDRHAVAQDAEDLTLEARAVVVDGAGAATEVYAAWLASNPRMLAVVPRRGAAVGWTVRLEGRCTVAVRHGAESRLVAVEAVRTARGWQVEVLQ
jgi:hypothetical protein